MNQYLEKIAKLSEVGKLFARKVAKGLSSKPATEINNVFNRTHGAVSPRMKGILTNQEISSTIKQVGDKANSSMGEGKLYPFEATRAARAGSRLARMAASKGN